MRGEREERKKERKKERDRKRERERERERIGESWIQIILRSQDDRWKDAPNSQMCLRIHENGLMSRMT